MSFVRWDVKFKYLRSIAPNKENLLIDIIEDLLNDNQNSEKKIKYQNDIIKYLCDNILKSHSILDFLRLFKPHEFRHILQYIKIDRKFAYDVLWLLSMHNLKTFFLFEYIYDNKSKFQDIENFMDDKISLYKKNILLLLCCKYRKTTDYFINHLAKLILTSKLICYYIKSVPGTINTFSL